MANFNGILDQFNQYQAPGDLNLINQTLAINQNKYDLGEKIYNDNLAQLKQQENLLLRDIDKKRFSQNVQGLINEINGKEGGINWAKRGLTNKINSYTNQALDNYTLDQIGISQSIKIFGAEVAKKREKNDGSYADQNYVDAQEQAGLGSYLSGASNTIGSLTYSNYVDVNGKMSKKAKEYSELMGREQLLDTTSGQYYTTDTKGKRVTMSEIYNTLKTELGQDDLNQLRINARQSLGKLSKKDLSITMNSKLNEDIAELKTESASLKAQMLAKPKSEREPFANAIIEKDKIIERKQNSINNEDYDIYSAYQDMTIKNIASNYDFEIITDVKRDYGQLNILKFQHDVMNDQRDYDEKVRTNNLKEIEIKAISTPTEIDKVQISGEEKDAFTKISDEQRDSLNSLDAMLLVSNENDYKNMSSQEKLAYRMNLPISPTDSQERQNAVRAVQTANKAWSGIVNANTETLKTTTQTVFNSITGAKLDNLANTAPYTVSAKKSGKKFEELDKNIQKGIMLELGSNMIEFDNIPSEQQKVVKASLNSLAGQLYNHPSDKVKSIFNQVSEAYKYSKNQKTTSSSEERKILLESGVRAPIISNRFGRGFSLNQDNNITEIEQGEDALKDASTIFKAGFSTMKNTADERAKISEKNLISNKAFAFSTENKSQQPDTERLRGLILSIKADDDSVQTPSANNNSYAISRKGTGYEISYMTGKTGSETMVKLYTNTLPQETIRKFQQGETNWNSSFMNPNLITPIFNITTQTPTQVYETVKDIYKARPDVISPQDYVQIATKKSFFGTPFQTKEEYLDALEGQPEEKIKRAEYYLDANYEIKPEVENGILMGNVNITYPDGKKESLPFISKSKELDNTRLYMEGMQYVKALKDEKIYKIFK